VTELGPAPVGTGHWPPRDGSQRRCRVVATALGVEVAAVASWRSLTWSPTGDPDAALLADDAAWAAPNQTPSSVSRPASSVIQNVNQ
jgi:hypothetical protein